MTQMNHPGNRDLVSTVLEDIKDFKIDLELEDIKHMTKFVFKRICEWKGQRGSIFIFDEQQKNHETQIGLKENI